MKGYSLSCTNGDGYGVTAPGFTQEHSRQMCMRCEHIKRECKWSLSIVDFERRIASMPSTPAGQPFAAHWLLGCKQRSLPCQVGCMHLPNCHSRHNLLPRIGCSAVNNAVTMSWGCMHLPNCHPRHRALRLDEPRYSRGISGRSSSLVQRLIPRGKAL